MYVGALSLDLLLGDVRSRKQKRSAVRPIVAQLQRHFPAIAIAETGHLDVYRRAELGVAIVASTAAHCVEVLESCENLVASLPEIELISARQRLFNDEEE